MTMISVSGTNEQAAEGRRRALDPQQRRRLPLWELLPSRPARVIPTTSIPSQSPGSPHAACIAKENEGRAQRSDGAEP